MTEMMLQCEGQRAESPLHYHACESSQNHTLSEPFTRLDHRGGMIAPMLGGVLLMMDRTIPVYTSVVVFTVAGFFVLLVPERHEEKQQKQKGERTIVH